MAERDIETNADVVLKPVERLLNYHIKENHLPSGYAVLFGQSALIFIAAAGLLYSKPAADFADHEHLGISKGTQIFLNIIDTCYSACIVLCAATIFFYRFHVKPQQVPEELSDIIEPPFTTAEYIRKNVIIGVAAALSAIPFVTIAYMAYSSSLPAYEFYLLVSYIFLANTFLHFLPIKLILDDPLYGAVPQYLKKLILQYLDWKEREKIPLDNAIQQQSNILVTALNSRFAEVMSDRSKARSCLNRIKAYSYNQLVNTITFSVVNVPSLTSQERQAARLIGALLVVASCIGYLANPYLVFHHELGWAEWQAALMTILPTFFLTVLFTYFGDTMGQKIWADIKADARYLSLCFAQDPANPPVFLETPIFKLYPKVALSCMVLNTFLAIFSAAAAMEMMHYAFADSVSEGALLTLYILAQIGVSIVAMYAPLDYQKLLMTYYALYCETGVEHDIIMFYEGIQALQGDLFRLKSSAATQDAAISSSNTCLTTWCSWCYEKEEEQTEDKRPLLTMGEGK